MKRIRKLLTTVTVLVLAAMMLSTTAFAATGEATVNTHMLNVRQEPNMYSLIVEVAYEGNVINVLEDDGSGWVKVTFKGQTGYMNKLFLTFKDSQPVQSDTGTNSSVQAATVVTTGYENATIQGNGVYMRSGPSLNSSVLNTLYTGNPVQANGVTGDWYEVVFNGQTGYVHKEYVVLNGSDTTYTVTTATVSENPGNAEPAGNQGGQSSGNTPAGGSTAAPATPAPSTPTPAPSTPTPAPVPSSSVGQSVVDTAMQYIGVPYVWGGTSPSGFDCSGLVYYAYKQHGITINRVAQSMYYNGVAVDTNSLQPGDILLFGSSVYNIWHCGMYVGNGMFIHAAGSGTTVRTDSLSALYGMRLVAARRIL